MQKIAFISIALSCAIAPDVMAGMHDVTNGNAYITVGGGQSYLNDSAFNSGATGSFNYDSGLGAFAAIGYAPDMLSNDSGEMRFELEGSYRLYRIDDSTINGITATNEGHIRYQTIMVNAYYDPHIWQSFQPYVGLGVGEAFTSLSDSAALNAVNQQDNRFAWQAMVGISYTPELLPASDVLLGYRYMNMGAPEYEIAGAQTELDSLYSNNVEFAIRYHF